MPKLKNKLPKLTKDGNYACVYYNRKRYRLGIWGSAEAKTAYARFIAKLQSDPVTFETEQRISRGDVLIAELAAEHFKHIQGRMHPAHINHFKVTIGYLDIYGDIAVNEFSPKKLKAVRNQMIKAGTLCRNVINDFIRRIICIFAWGVEEELVQPHIVTALREVKALRKGEKGTFDHPPRKAVPDDVIRRTLPFMSPTVRTMVMIQRLTGMRPTEICKMTVGDIDQTRGNGLWHYTLKAQETEQCAHKTEEHIGEKIIPLGVPEQVLLAPYLVGKKPTDAVFSPRTAMAEHYAERRASRKSKITPSQAARDKVRAEKPDKRYGEFYDQSSYRGAVLNAIDKGNKELPDDQKIPHWTPYQIRHSAGTAAEKEGGLDKAQALLAHRSANVTKRYAHGQLAIAEEMARKRENPFEAEDE